jgi:hypothetical protein
MHVAWQTFDQSWAQLSYSWMTDNGHWQWQYRPLGQQVQVNDGFGVRYQWYRTTTAADVLYLRPLSVLCMLCQQQTVMKDALQDDLFHNVLRPNCVVAVNSKCWRLTAWRLWCDFHWSWLQSTFCLPTNHNIDITARNWCGTFPAACIAAHEQVRASHVIHRHCYCIPGQHNYTNNTRLTMAMTGLFCMHMIAYLSHHFKLIQV